MGFTIGQAKVSRKFEGEVSAFPTRAQMASLAISLGIATSVLIRKSTNEIAVAYPELPLEVIESTINGVNSEIFELFGGETRLAVARNVAQNVGRVFYLNVAGAGLGFVCILFMKFERMDLTTKALYEGGE